MAKDILPSITVMTGMSVGVSATTAGLGGLLSLVGFSLGGPVAGTAVKVGLKNTIQKAGSNVVKSFLKTLPGYATMYSLEGSSVNLEAFQYFVNQGVPKEEAAAMAWDSGHRVGMINGLLELIPFKANLTRALKSKVGFKSLKERLYAGTLKDYMDAATGKQT